MVGVSSKWFRQWQSIRRPSFWQSGALCLLSSRFRRIEHQNNTLAKKRGLADPINATRGVVGTVRHPRCGGTSAFVHAFLLDDPPRAVVTIDDDEDDLGTDICMYEKLKRAKMEWKTPGSDVDADGFKSSSQALGRTREGVQPSVHMSIWISCELLVCIPLLSCNVSGTCINFFFEDARRRSADDALWSGKHEAPFKGSRLQYLAMRGGMAQSDRCVPGISSNRLGVAFLVDIHRTSVNRWELRFPGAVHGEQEGLVPRCARETLQTKRNRITWIASFDSHCIFTEETPPTQLSAEGRSCKTAKQCPCILRWTSTRRQRGLTCTACGMYAMYLKQISSYG